jgi:hypothetical protein
MAKHWRDAMNERNQDWINNRDKPREIVTKVPTKKYHEGWDRIFGDKNGTVDPKKPTE